ncbi:MAG TPA: TetR/AcrR family transcriptional regulator [Candidatus Saccharimonadales bacterium]|nr:TetR/AcrR family transcriptional regulator [Candidatus Saccharimonadales bacterium]
MEQNSKADLGHREQKKRQTRQALVTSALKLFVKKGFDNTTIAEIAEAANCAPRTFFLYFDSKEDLLPAALEWASENLATALRGRAPGTTLEVFQQWLLANLEHHAGPRQAFPHPSFAARQKYYLGRLLEPILTKCFAEDLGLPSSSTQAKLIAVSAVAILATLDFEQMTHQERVRYVNQGIAFLRAGINALGKEI